MSDPKCDIPDLTVCLSDRIIILQAEEKKALRESRKNEKKAAKQQRAEKTANRQKEEAKKEFKIESRKCFIFNVINVFRTSN